VHAFTQTDAFAEDFRVLVGLKAHLDIATICGDQRNTLGVIASINGLHTSLG